MGGLELIFIHKSLFLAAYRKNDIVTCHGLFRFFLIQLATTNAVVTFISVICRTILEPLFFFITSAHQLSRDIEQHSDIHERSTLSHIEDFTQRKVVIRHIIVDSSFKFIT